MPRCAHTERLRTVEEVKKVSITDPTGSLPLLRGSDYYLQFKECTYYRFSCPDVLTQRLLTVEQVKKVSIIFTLLSSKVNVVNEQIQLEHYH